MRQLHAGAQRHLHEVQYLRRNERLQLTTNTAPRKGAAGVTGCLAAGPDPDEMVMGRPGSVILPGQDIADPHGPSLSGLTEGLRAFRGTRGGCARSRRRSGRRQKTRAVNY
ncbi:hypothetical protein GCM10017056_26050 [Seohaeicola zhoushanensis]|uniref:Uncharacterized protein n=1 Tax=Seohaeicola zhoushanensis TaxID=1569283 RepID=A0A8J3GYX6_9RHOB|nr:hypothetical protein GCM10017056_26050 [Seohaeicola zhoushanensis]